jgi:exopolyphosphatase / guanosine-5'-triphosphate,3'-diphosphate pyrophosphatase
VKFAAIDIGSNAVRLLITEVIEVDKNVKYKKRLFVRVPLRLGEDAFKSHVIGEEKSYQLVKAVQSFKNLIELFKASDFRACATSAIRESFNGKDVIDKIFAHTGIYVDIIDGKKEAEIIYTNHVAESLNPEGEYLYVDVGGGSTELTLFSHGKIIFSNSFPVGAVRMLLNRVSEESWDEFKKFVKENCRDVKRLVAIGTGGNINKLCKIVDGKKTISAQELKHLYQKLSDCTYEERIQRFGLNEDRADVIVPAAKVYNSVMKWAQIDEMYVPKLGLADGIIHQLYEKQLAQKAKTVSRG